MASALVAHLMIVISWRAAEATRVPLSVYNIYLGYSRHSVCWLAAHEWTVHLSKMPAAWWWNRFTEGRLRGRRNVEIGMLQPMRTEKKKEKLGVHR